MILLYLVREFYHARTTMDAVLSDHNDKNIYKNKSYRKNSPDVKYK